MANEKLRYETGKGTIPRETTYAGALAQNPVNPNVYDYTGALLLDAVFGTNSAYNKNLFAYDKTNNEVRYIKQTIGEGNSATWSLLLDAPFTGNPSDVSIVVATLMSYSVANTGGAAGELNEITFPAGEVFNEEPNSNRALTQRNCAAISFDATGTAFSIKQDFGINETFQ